MSPASYSPPVPMARFVKLLAIALVVAVLYAAQAVLKPLALAILLSFLLALPVRALERRGLKRPWAVAAVSLLAFSVLTLVAWLMAAQLLELARELPGYRHNMLAKVHDIRASGSGTPWARALDVLEEVGQELSGHSPRRRGGPPPPPEPAPVTISDDSPLTTWIGPLLEPLGAALAVAVLVVFFLIEREELRNRLIRLAGQSSIAATTQALIDASQRVGHYLLMQLWINLAFGVPLTLGLWAIGVPNFLLWGALAVVLRYLPYVGPWLSAAPPILLALAIFPDWWHAGLTAALFFGLELLTSQFVEPLAYGSRVGVTPVALIIAALFWTWLWGFVGLILAAPLTVCLVVLGRSVSQLEFLSILFSDEPALAPPVGLYQRLLSQDLLETMTLADQFARENGRVALFDRLLLPALRLAERDRSRDALTEEQEIFVHQALRDMVDEAAARSAREPEAPASPEVPAEGAAVAAPKPAWLCLPAASEADEIAGLMLTQLAREECAMPPILESPRRLLQEIVAEIEKAGATAVCISIVLPGSLIKARSLCKRLRSTLPELRLVIGLWDGSEDPRTAASFVAAGAQQVVTTLAEALAALCPESPLVQREAAQAPPALPAASRLTLKTADVALRR